MKHLRRPPALATWVLDRSGADAAVIGDLIEEYGRGRSQVWFWKQVLSVLVSKAAPSNLRAVRWFIALPTALLAAAAVPEITLFFFTRTFLNTFLTGNPALYITSFFMASMFLSTGVLMAPTRKESVARIALAVVAFWGLVLAMANPLFSGQAFRRPQVLGGISLLLGGVVGYLCCRRHEPSRAGRITYEVL